MIDKEKIFNYMDWVYLVNEEEVLGMAQYAYAYALWEDPDEYQLSYWEILVAQEIAEEYIKRNDIKFDENGDIIVSDSEGA